MKFFKRLGKRFVKLIYDKFYETCIEKLSFVRYIFRTVNIVYTESTDLDGIKFKLAYGIEDKFHLNSREYGNHVKSVFPLKGMKIVGIGASIGYYTLLALKKVGKLIFRGIQNLLKMCCLIIVCEAHPRQIVGYKINDLRRLLTKVNYKIYLIEEDGLKRVEKLQLKRLHYLFLER